MALAGDLDAARRAAKRNAHGAVARGERRRERTDFDGGGKRLIAEQRVGGRERETIHRAARHQTIALIAVAAMILHGTRRPNR